MSTFTLSLNGVQVIAKDLAINIGETPTRVARGLNLAAKDVRKNSVAKIVSQVKLPLSYVEDRVDAVEEATPQHLIATISADKRGTNLSRYNAEQLTRDIVWTLEKYIAVFGSRNYQPPIRNKSGNWFYPRYIHRTGDARRGIAKGKKAAGVRIAVKKSTDLKHVFLLPTMRPGQNESKFVLAQRTGASRNKIKSLYGPSVDQMINRVWASDKSDIADIIEKSILQQVKI